MSSMKTGRINIEDLVELSSSLSLKDVKNPDLDLIENLSNLQLNEKAYKDESDHENDSDGGKNDDQKNAKGHSNDKCELQVDKSVTADSDKNVILLKHKDDDEKSTETGEICINKPDDDVEVIISKPDDKDAKVLTSKHIDEDVKVLTSKHNDEDVKVLIPKSDDDDVKVLIPKSDDDDVKVLTPKHEDEDVIVLPLKHDDEDVKVTVSQVDDTDNAENTKDDLKECIAKGEDKKTEDDDLKPKYLPRGIGYAGNFDTHELLSTPGPVDGYNSMNMEDAMNVNFGNDIYNDNMGYNNGLLMSPDASPLSSYTNPSSSSSYYDPGSNNSVWLDSPEGSPYQYEQIDPYQYECTNISGDSDNETNLPYNYNNFLTPPRSVSPPKMNPDTSSAFDQSCMQIVDLIVPYGQNGHGSTPDDELKKLINAVDYGQDNMLQGLKAYINENRPADLKTNQWNNGGNDMGYNQEAIVDTLKAESYWQEVQQTDVNELNVYLPSVPFLDAREVEEEIRAACDPNILFDLESRVCTVLCNNPLSIIPDDEHRDTNLTVLACRNENNRENLVEKIYALSKGLSNVHVCCDVHVQHSQCPNCGNTNQNTFYTPLTLRNVQGYTALSCAVLSGYPTIIVKYLVMLIQQNKQDLKREFSEMTNSIYLEAKDYPFLARFAASYNPPNWN